MPNKKKQEWLFTCIDNRIFKWVAKKKISMTDCVLYCALMRHIDPHDPHAEVWPGNKRLLNDFGLGQDAVQTGLSNLERCGIIERVSKSKFAYLRKWKIKMRVELRKKVSGVGQESYLTSEPTMPTETCTQWRGNQKAEREFRKARKRSFAPAQKQVEQFNNDVPF